MAQSQYLTLSEYGDLSLLPAALGSISDDVKTARIKARSSWADSYLAAAYKLPLTAWEDDLQNAVAMAVDWDLMCRRGFNPDAGADVAIRQRFEDAERWLKDVAGGKATAMVTDSSSGADAGDSTVSPVVLTSETRGWTDDLTDEDDEDA